jgi:hypothetical protein
MDDVLDLVLEEEPVADPAAYFAVPDEEKERAGAGDGAVGVVTPQDLA